MWPLGKCIWLQATASPPWNVPWDCFQGIDLIFHFIQHIHFFLAWHTFSFCLQFRRMAVRSWVAYMQVTHLALQLNIWNGWAPYWSILWLISWLIIYCCMPIMMGMVWPYFLILGTSNNTQNSSGNGLLALLSGFTNSLWTWVYSCTSVAIEGTWYQIALGAPRYVLFSTYRIYWSYRSRCGCY